MTSIPVRVFAALAALFLLAGCGGGDAAEDGQTGTADTDAPAITGEPASYNSADVTFASTMVPHHQQSIELATMLLERPDNPELATLANQIIATQQPEINILNVFLVQWNENPEIQTDPGGADTDDASGEPPIPGTIDAATIEKLKSLRGPEFDKLWLQSMIAQQQGTVEMAKAEVADGANDDAKSVAQAMVTGLGTEITRMKQILEGLP